MVMLDYFMISQVKVKMTVWDKVRNENSYPKDVKLEGSVPSNLLLIGE